MRTNQPDNPLLWSLAPSLAVWVMSTIAMSGCHRSPSPKCPDGMAYIKGGTFLMGSAPEDDSANLRPHEVTLDAYCIDKFEVHDENGLPTTSHNWFKAKGTCEKRGGRLPTEAEWEFAARGTELRPFPWGSESPTCERANLHECGGKIMKVGSHPTGASPEGVHDLIGNAAEFVEDCWDVQPSESQTNPHRNNCSTSGPHKNWLERLTGRPGDRIIRGFSANIAFPSELLSIERLPIWPYQTGSFSGSQEDEPSVGYRCVVEIPRAKSD